MVELLRAPGRGASTALRVVEIPSGRRPRAVVWTVERIEHWRRTGERPAVAVWTPQETGAFLDAATAHRLYPLYHLIAYRRLRRGEAVGIRWPDVELDAGYLRITQQVVQLGWATEVGKPKTDSGERTVSLDSATVEVLRRWRDRQDAERSALVLRLRADPARLPHPHAGSRRERRRQVGGRPIATRGQRSRPSARSGSRMREAREPARARQ